MKTVYAFLADGLEEVECLMVVDLLRRAKLNVVTVSIKEELMVESSHKVKFFADKTIDEIDFEQGDCIFLPGGMPGAATLDKHEGLRKLILDFAAKGKPIAAICAAPMVLGKLGLDTQEQKADTNYMDGIQGLLNAQNGQQLNLSTLGNSSLAKQVKTKACDLVLKQGVNFLS